MCYLLNNKNKDALKYTENKTLRTAESQKDYV